MRVCACACQEVKHTEGSFQELRAKGAPDEGPAYVDADAASQVRAYDGSSHASLPADIRQRCRRLVRCSSGVLRGPRRHARHELLACTPAPCCGRAASYDPARVVYTTARACVYVPSVPRVCRVPQALSAVAPVGVRLLAMRKLRLPAGR
jgi:hypothetical protein